MYFCAQRAPKTKMRETMMFIALQASETLQAKFPLHLPDQYDNLDTNAGRMQPLIH